MMSPRLLAMDAGSLTMSNPNRTIQRDVFLSLNPVILTKQETKEIKLLLEKVKKERAKNA
jgi:hypothetical protein